MRYIDSGFRDPSQAMGTWLADTLSTDAAQVRWQSGFFGANGLGIVQEPLRQLAYENGIVRVLIGSNDQCTARQDVEALIQLLGLPRSNAELGIISYGQGYYHPKTVHIARRDGSQAAYVGSANLTESGISSLHVEAGITLDSRDGDNNEVLNDIATAVDSWFSTGRNGIYRVGSLADVDRLVDVGVLAKTPSVRVRTTRPEIENNVQTPVLAKLIALLQLPKLEGRIQASSDVIEPIVRQVLLPATPRYDFPPYLLFSPGQSTPTEGTTALSGSSLPGGVTGLIIHLNHDTGRFLDGHVGTANISLPIPTLSTFRFGIQEKRLPRPRAEFGLRPRYISNDRVISEGPSQTNIMGYGMLPGEKSHSDVRMLIPASVKDFANAVRSAGKPMPRIGDVALLEWPTTNDDAEFRLSFLDNRIELFREAEELLQGAILSGQSIGGDACWLPKSVSPLWS